jgi:hypothetical protein
MPPLVGLLALALLFWPRPRRRNPIRRRRSVLPNLMAYTDAKGRIRPIRASDDYDPDVDVVERERRQREHQATRYRGVRREQIGRLTGGVDRPPWAAGFTNAQLERIARDHGQRASREGWWESAHLTSGSAELRRLLRESGYRQEKTRTGHATRAGRKPRSRSERISTRRHERAVALASATGRGRDLPF